ncbi:LacI family DNA-binding transcriptional regulator [Frigoribacterium faeni]|uniref:LacI family DNA-binding transcriptional regulator n=1 Tax=Frigoribacterium faeni TaxID=145483 RepID=UPI00141B88BE|nr:LacI family DNA-binding transcriptional regulator [Frigoribacterium faeni]NIJ04926.1 DNA-binding LacI/PurR family transcriptional regulator [Frigoribacterium faeni]
MRATVKDVAARAGVSPKTVSNVVTGAVPVSAETRARVEEAVAALDYVPNLSARGLRTGRTGVVALALPDLSTPYSAEMSHWFVEVAHERGWSVQLEQTGRRPERERELLLRGKEHLVDGLVLNPVSLGDSAVVGAESLPPVVLIGEVEQSVVDHVRVDSVAAARDMTTHLIELGHRRIAVLGSSGEGFDPATARVRSLGWQQALEAAGLPVDPSLRWSCPAWSTEAGAATVRERIAVDGAPDAVFCFTDSLALGALHALWSAGLRVPDDVAVAGFDDIAESRFSLPPLTTVSLDKRLYAERTLELLAARIADRDRPPELAVVPHQIVRRASTAARA